MSFGDVIAIVKSFINPIKSDLQAVAWTKVADIPATCMVGYYPSNGAYNAGINKNVINFGMIPLKNGTVAKIDDHTTGHIITGIRAYIYAEDMTYVKTIGNYTTSQSITMDSDCYALITLLIPNTYDGNDMIPALSQSVLIATDGLDYKDRLFRDYKRLPITVEIGSLDLGKPVAATNTARTSFVMMPKGSKIWLLNNRWQMKIWIYDIENKSWISKDPDTSSWIYNIYTVSSDCYIRILIRNRPARDLTSDDLENMRNTILFNISQITDSYELPAYYYEDDYIQDKISDINALGKEIGFTGDLFVFLTDTHWTTGNNKRSPMLLKYVMDRTSAKRVLFGGDACNTETTADEIYNDYHVFRSAFDYLNGDKWLPIVGNHEYYPNTQANPNVITPADMYSMIIRESEQFIKPYHELVYTFTNDRAGIVYLMLSAATRGSDYNAPGQLDAFKAALDDVPAGYHVLVVTHGAVDENNALYTEFADYQDELEERKENGLDVIGVLCGHVHGDFLYEHGDVTVISCVSDGGIPKGVTKTIGTVTEQAISFVGIDKANREVTIIRVGAGEDRTFDY